MIKYNNNTIYDWNFDTSNVIKVYRNNAIVFYKFSGGSPTPEYKVCFAVVDDISQYTDREFEDVYDNATEKWYKLNNLNQYEEYGVYGSGRGITYYKGKLTIDEGYEYEWNGSSWVNLGEIEGSSRLPQGYTEVEYIENTGTSYLDTNFVPNQDTRVVCDMQLVTASDYPRLWGAGVWNSANGLMIDYERGNLRISWLGESAWTSYTSVPTSFDRKVYDVNKNYLYVDETLIGFNTYTTRTASDPIGVFTYIGSGRPSSSSYWGQEHFKGKMYSFKVYDNGTLIRDLVPCKRDNDNTVGAYDIVNDVFYTVPAGYTTDKLIAGTETGTTEYPKYYSEKTDPLDNLTFNTMAEAQTYAYNNCVYDGMKATIDSKSYYFDSSDENGWVEEAYTQYEYIRTSSASTQYYTFNTNFYPTTANTLEVKFEMTDRSIDWGNIVSWNQNQSSSQFFFGTVTNSYQAIVRTGGNNGVSYRPTIGANKVVVYTLPLSAISGTYSVDGGAAQTIQYNYTAMQLPSTVSMRFFGNDDGSIVGKSAAGKMYYVKVYDGNGNLVKHYVPSDNNGTPCFYEIVDGEYIMDTYTGSNHGTLTLGPEV